jgi:hypothetical protein
VKRLDKIMVAARDRLDDIRDWFDYHWPSIAWGPTDKPLQQRLLIETRAAGIAPDGSPMTSCTYLVRAVRGMYGIAWGNTEDGFRFLGLQTFDPDTNETMVYKGKR